MVAIIKDGKVTSKIVRLFLGGDYDFLCENYDHPDACSTNFCIWCPITLREKRNEEDCNGIPWEEVQLNTLEELKNRSRKKRDPVFRVDLSRVVVLPLHTNLGLTEKYLELLRKDVSGLMFFK